VLAIGFDGFPLGGFKGAYAKVQNSFVSRHFEQAEELLKERAHLVKVICMARDFGFQDHPDLKTLACQFSVDAYAEKAEALILDQFPCADNFDEPDRLMPELLGLNFYTWDDVSNALYTPDGSDSEFSLEAFLLYLILGETEFWEKNKKAYDWPFTDMPALPEDSTFWDLDAERARQYLRDCKCETMIAAINYAFDPPDTFFFMQSAEDYGEMDEEEEKLLEFTSENVRRLVDEYEECKPVLAAYHEASEAVAKDPQLLTTLFSAILFGMVQPKVEEKARVRE